MDLTKKLKTFCAASLLGLPLVLFSGCEPPRDTTTPRADERGQMERQQQQDPQRGAFGGIEQEEQRAQPGDTAADTVGDTARQDQEREQREQQRIQEEQQQQGQF